MPSHRAKATCAGVASGSGGASSGPALSPRASRTARHGHSGGAPSSCEQRPHATANPLLPRLDGQVGDQPGLADAGFADHLGAGEGRRPQPARAGPTAPRARSGGPRWDHRGRRRAQRRVPRRAIGTTDGGRDDRERSGSARSRGPGAGPPPPGARSRDPGSMPSSSTKVARTVRSASRASACRPARTRARAWVAHRASSIGLRAVADPVVASTPGVVADRQQAQQPGLLGSGPQPVEGGPRRQDVGVVGQVGVRLSAPGREHVVEPVDRPRHLGTRRPPGGRPDRRTATPRARAPGRRHPRGRRRRGRRRPRRAHAARSRGPSSRSPRPPPGKGAPARGRSAGRTGRRAATPVRCEAVHLPTPGRPGCRRTPVVPGSGPGRRRSTAACVSRAQPPRPPGR